MPDPKISTLESVDVRRVWPDESRDFTPWLAEPENLTRLGEALGLTLEPRGTEQAVGSFSADILCRRLDGGSDDESLVVIENQYGRTNHDHLGKLLTYAAGLSARTVVWIAEEFRDEHREALDQLNASTALEYAYFGVEIELLRIDGSLPAPRFNIVVQPNDWTKTVRPPISPGELSEPKQLQLQFWTQFQRLMDSESEVSCSRPKPVSYLRHNVRGVSGFRVVSTFTPLNSAARTYSIGEIRVDFVIERRSGQLLFEQLVEARETIEREAKQRYSWISPSAEGRGRIFVQRDAEFANRKKWPEYHKWLRVEVERMFKVLVPRAKEVAS